MNIYFNPSNPDDCVHVNDFSSCFTLKQLNECWTYLTAYILITLQHQCCRRNRLKLKMVTLTIQQKFICMGRNTSCACTLLHLICVPGWIQVFSVTSEGKKDI